MIGRCVLQNRNHASVSVTWKRLPRTTGRPSYAVIVGIGRHRDTRFLIRSWRRTTYRVSRGWSSMRIDGRLVLDRGSSWLLRWASAGYYLQGWTLMDPQSGFWMVGYTNLVANTIPFVRDSLEMWSLLNLLVLASIDWVYAEIIIIANVRERSKCRAVPVIFESYS